MRFQQYFGRSIPINDKSCYINASVLCSNYETSFESINRTNYWNNFITSLTNKYGYVYSDLIKKIGMYYFIHPVLLHFLLEHIDPEYTAQVNTYMYMLSDKSDMMHTTLANEIDDLESEIYSIRVHARTNT